jgi:hypothetical protein
MYLAVNISKKEKKKEKHLFVTKTTTYIIQINKYDIKYKKTDCFATNFKCLLFR